MKLLSALLLLSNLCLPINTDAGIKPALPKLSIDVYKTVSDAQGVVQPQLLAVLVVGDLIKFSRADGFEYSGKITDIQETPESLKIYGVCNDENINFGFALIKGGIFAGAVIDKKQTEVYTLEFSAAHKGYVLIKNFKHSKNSNINI